MQKTGGREEVGPVGPRGPSRSTADEAGFPAAARDPHPGRTAGRGRGALPGCLLRAGRVASAGVSPLARCTSGARLRSPPAVTHRCSRRGQRGAGRQGDPARPSGHFQVIASSVGKGSDGGIHQRRGTRGKQRRRNALSARKGQGARVTCPSVRHPRKTTEPPSISGSRRRYVVAT